MQGYINKRRIAPQGYAAVTKQMAHTLYDKGADITICGNNVNSYHIFDGWHLGCTVNKERYGDYTFDVIVNNFLSYLERDLGTYAVYYVKLSDL